MKKLFVNQLILLAAVFATTSLSGPVRAAVFPVATNPAVMEFSSGIVPLGTNYLVGYISGTNLTGQLVSGNGELVGSPQVMGANPSFPPAATVTGAKTNCLVTWSDTSLNSGATMFGRIISAAGSPVGAKFPLLGTIGSHGFQYVQATASDGTNFLVVWQDAANTSFYGQWVTAMGTLSGPEFFLFTPGHGVGNRNVAATFGRTNFIIVWQGGGNGTNNTYCQLISPGGSGGSTLQVSTVASLDDNPMTAAFDGTNYLVVWSRDTQTDNNGQPLWQLCGRFVSPGGTTVGNELVLVTELALFPALAFDGANYLLAWGYNSMTTNSDRTIHARFVDRSANAIGPVITPFMPQGTSLPLLPLTGLMFDGSRYWLVATYGAFIQNGSGDVVGFDGGDVYGGSMASSTRPPVFSQATIGSGLFQTQLKVVPGQTYTIETSSNLLSWTPRGTISSDATNLVSLVDKEGMTNASRLFYRAAIGNTIGASFTFAIHEFASAGGFGSGFTPAPTFPVGLNGYAANVFVDNDLNFPAATNVFFTGPAGSGLTSAAADANNSSLNATDAQYQTPFVSSPAAAPGGTWTVNYRGTNVTFNISDLQAASRLVVPLPTVTVSGGVLQSVSWVYRDATTGAALAGAPAYVTDLQVQIEGVSGGRLYDSPTLGSGITSHALASSVTWTNVAAMFMAYDDSLGNSYIVSFAKP
jgi:hypothetical protein